MLTMKTRNEIFHEHFNEYKKARNERNKCALTRIITAIATVTGMHRKSIIKHFTRLQCSYPHSGQKRGRKVIYTPDCLYALQTVWRVGNHCCGELLHPMIPIYVAILKRDHLWKHPQIATVLLLRMKLSTVKRKLKAFSTLKPQGKGLSSTKSSQLKHLIPIFHGSWKRKPPGTGQVDTVAHCGHTLLGDFVYSLQYIDVSTYWTVLRAQWNKGKHATLENVEYIQTNLPWPLLEMHPDTGSEFINWLLKEWCDTVNVLLTRSRPGHSNDNTYVEERNGNIIRKYIGYVRLDTKEAVDALNKVYEVLCLYLNHFMASRRVVEKVEVKGKWKKKYEKTAKTPYQRVMESTEIPEAVKAGLRSQHEKLNPLVLLEEVERRKKVLYDIQKKYGKPTPEPMSGE